MSRRPHSDLAHSNRAGAQPRAVPRPAPGKRTRTARAYGDGAAAAQPASSPAAEGRGARPLNIDYGMLPPEVYAMERAEGAVSQAATSTGQPLPEDLADRFSASLGADLSRVRVHAGAESASAARAVGAKAYAVGQDVHFAAGQYDPASAAGQHLLAHEVAHTVQQSGGGEVRQNKLEVSSPGDAHEAEADRAAEAMVAGQSTTITTAAPGGVSRFWDEVSQFFGIGEEEVVATKTPYQPSPEPSAQPSAQPSSGGGVDLAVQRAEQDLAISQGQLAAAQQADAAAKANLEQASAALAAAREQHAQAASDGAAGVPGTAANGRLAAAEQRTRAAESAVEVATRTAERCAQELKDAEANERVMYANLEEARRNAAARGQAGGQPAQGGGQEGGSFWDAFW